MLSNAKLRMSTGWLGNDGLVDAYSCLRTYTESTNSGYTIGGSFRPGMIMTTNPNEYLTWGKTHDYNFATDLGFWDGRFGVSFEYYIRYETDKITAAPDYLYPPSTGVDGMVPNENFSKLKAWGWDLTINHRNTIGKLKTEYREVILLFYYQNCTIEEIAQILNVPSGTVSSRLTRGRNKLREMLVK